MAKEIRFWQDKIFFEDGWFGYYDGKGNYSVISRECACKMVSDYNAYQASQDVERGGMDMHKAFAGRGFELVNDKYVYMGKDIEILPDGPIREIGEILEIPEKIGNYPINRIHNQAFMGEKLIKKVVLHEKIDHIGQKAFADCENLWAVQGLSEKITVMADAFANTKLFEGECAEYLKNVLLKVNTTNQGRFVVKRGITSIAEKAFMNCKEITEIDLPESVEYIENFAFQDCENLEIIHMPKTLLRLDAGVFAGCKKLKSIIIPEGVPEIHRGTFYGCESLLDVKLPETIVSIGFDAFRETALMKQFDEGTEEALYVDNWLIRYKADFAETLYIRKGTLGVADMNSFHKRYLKGVTFPEGLKYIGSEAFERTDLKSVKLPRTVELLKRSAFRGTKIQEITLPESVKQVEQWVFMDCEALDKIVVEGKNTQIIWPAITGHRNGTPTIIEAPTSSRAKVYCEQYGAKYHLVFAERKPVVKNNIFTLRRKK